MRRLHLFDCRFHNNTHITDANLTGATLLNCRLNGIEACRVTLHRARIDHTAIKDANLSGADMRDSTITDSDFSGSDFSQGTLEGASVTGGHLRDVLMAECIISGIRIEGVSLAGADLSSAIMNHVSMINVGLKNILLNNSLTLHLPEWNHASQGRYLAHPTDSLLRTLEGIPPQYSKLKIRLAEQLVDSLERSEREVTAVVWPLLNVLGRAFWRQSERIQTFNYQLIGQYLSAYNLRALPRLNQDMLSVILDNLQGDLPLAFRHQGAFTQLINQAVFTSQQTDLRRLALRTYHHYLQQPAVQASLRQRGSVEIVRQLQRSETDWRDNLAANFLLVSAQHAGPLMLISSTDLQLMLKPTPGSWDRYWLINHGCVLELENYATAQLVEDHFPLFRASWQAQQSLNPLNRLFTLLNMDDDLYTLFINASSQPASSRKLTSVESLAPLETIFRPLMTFDEGSNSEPTMTAQHYQEILNLYALNDASDHEKAATLFCIAIIFVRLASSTHLGDEDNSPYLLRFYSFICLKEAYRFDPDMFVVGPPPEEASPSIDDYPELKGRLLGTTQVTDEEPAAGDMPAGATPIPCTVTYVHCAETLATHMSELAKMVCRDTLNRFYPPTWN
ncbi:pentapeptide repeat-containing protein [Erwinia sp. V71]|uniref:pentapeptide repeat-containing protein n=1 Tax=Erwinia sp. V71 TaxID=3369424 RepID=UPI003F5EA0A1